VGTGPRTAIGGELAAAMAVVLGMRGGGLPRPQTARGPADAATVGAAAVLLVAWAWISGLRGRPNGTLCRGPVGGTTFCRAADGGQRTGVGARRMGATVCKGEP